MSGDVPDFGFPFEILGEENCPSHTQASAEELREKLSSAFSWSKTEDGWDFWDDVFDRLDRIAETGR